MKNLISLLIILLLFFHVDAAWSAPSKKKKVKKTTKTHRVYKAKTSKRKRGRVKKAIKRTVPHPVKYVKPAPRPPFDEQIVESVLNCSTYFCYVKFKSGEEGYSEVFEPGTPVYAPKKGALYISKKKMERRLRDLDGKQSSP